MSFEPGGRADKYGNSFENRYLGKLLLRLVKEELISVTVEPLGENSNSVEFISEQFDGIIKYYQCKGSNADRSEWSISNLRKYNVFQRAKEILEADIKNLYYFISPLSYKELDELCKRARTNSSAQDFIKYQLTNPRIKALFYSCIPEFGLNKDDQKDAERTVSLLSRCFFERSITGTEADLDFDERISTLFTGKVATVRVLLEQYANSTGCYGRKITAKDILDYLEAHEIHFRAYCNDATVLDRIHVLNKTHWDSYRAIYEKLAHRTATDAVIESINHGHSVILHGKAGAGKSGCLEELIAHFKQTGTLYLAIKLDKHPPHKSADAYGRELDLPQSPVHCLGTMAAGKPCVLILDQLDALRWSSNHSSDALDICKELILQASAFNRHFSGNLSIIFASRTFDLENDKGLKHLFTPADAPFTLTWTKVNVSDFSKDDVLKIIGQTYDCLSPRLQRLLLTPSCLYVWTKLDENVQKSSISSVFGLMNAWWQQIQQKCISIGLSRQNIIDCKNQIVSAMETRLVFSLPLVLFAEQTEEISALVSLGLLNHNTNTKSISFTHQSFLDYFITFTMLKQIYEGYELVDLLGDRNSQIPMIRYRLLSVLQSLLENDVSQFVKQSLLLLSSSSVRFYFQCAVFDVIGQCDAPTPEIFQIVDEYIEKPEWQDYIAQVVLYGHPVFIRRLPELSNGTFPSDLLLSLLNSISIQQPDFIADQLCPFSLLSREQDYKIFQTLCPDAANDSDRLFELRIQLLRKNPDFFYNSWMFHGLMKQFSPRVIKLFEVLLESWPCHKISQLYISEANEISCYTRQYAWQIVTTLFPKICAITSNYLPQWPAGRWNPDYEDWTANDYRESAVRSITEIVKDAFAECAQSASDDLVALIRGIKYPLSAVGHECIMHAVCSLPVTYADEAIGWFLTDIDRKVFVFSYRGDDFLAYTAQILEKFSPSCNITFFRQMERYICTWKESAEEMLFTFRNRRKMRETYHEAVYYAYWGHLQKALLPHMDSSRLSNYAKDLINMINRNTWIHLPYFYCGFIVGETKTVVSPIDSYIERLSDKTWLQIISTPQDQMRNRWNGSDQGPYHISASQDAFASALGKQAKREPLRFAKLALSFPKNCFDGYIVHLLYALYDDSSKDCIDTFLASELIRRYGHSEDANIAIATARIIEKYADEAWPDDVLTLVAEIAVNHANPSEDEYNVTSDSDPTPKSAHMLLTNSMNCARGCALHAIAALLWKHCSLGDRFKPTILSASSDSNHAVRFAVMNSVLAYYRFEPAFATTVFHSLIEKDLRIIAAPMSWDILSREYDHYGSYYRKVLIEACRSEVTDLAEHAARLLCAAAIYYNDQDAFRFLMSHSFSQKQLEQICLQAVSSFNSEEYHEKSQHILMHLVDHASDTLHNFGHLFLDQRILIQRDEEFLIRLMESGQSEQLLYVFLKYLYESDEDICKFSHILNTIGKSLSQTPPGKSPQLMVRDLVQCVIRLFDKGKDDPLVRETCLDIWDNLFMGHLQVSQPLLDMMDAYS